MKKKNLTINRLALGNLKQRRKQYTILIIGIILAMVFSSSTLFFLYSSQETNIARQYKEIGYQDAIFRTEGDTEEIIRKAYEDGVVTDYGFAYIIGLCYKDEGGESMGAAIAWLDDNAKRLSNQLFIEGSYPVNENEIAIEENALLRLGINVKLGDEITLQVKTQNGAEYLDTVEKTYKLVGIAVDKKNNIQQHTPEFDNEMLPAAFVAQGTQTEPGGKELISAYVVGTDDYEENIWVNEEQYILNGPVTNIELYLADVASVDYVSQTTAVRTYWGYDSVTSIIDGGAFYIVIVIVLIFASCMAIINSFNTNLKERKRQIGLLRAVGATKRQIIRIFGREAFFISLICTPISIAISYGIVRVAISLLNEEAVFTKSIWVLVLCAVVNVVVTMLAALIPLILASRITPMQAIRNIDINRKMKVKKIKTQKQFSVPSHLAKRAAKLYKGGKIAVSVILSVTIIFSCLGFAFMKVESEAVYNLENDYTLYGAGYYSWSDWVNSEQVGFSEADKREIQAFPYFSGISSEKQINAIFEVDEITEFFLCFDGIQAMFQRDYSYGEYTREDFYTKIVDMNDKVYLEHKNDYGPISGKDVLPATLTSYEDSDLLKLEERLTAGKIDLDKLNSGEEIILVAPQTVKWAYEYVSDSSIRWGSYCDGDPIDDNMTVMCEGECPYKVGDKIPISVLQYKNFDETQEDESFTRLDKEVTVGAIISPEFNYLNDFQLLTTSVGMNTFSETAKYQYIGLKVDPNVEVDEDINETIMNFLRPFADKYSGWLDSEYERNQELRENTFSLYITMLSIIILGFAICGSIVNNSLTATIREKKKEIGTLRAVGADLKVLVSSYIRQLLSMFAYGYGIGFGGYIIILIIFNIMDKITNSGKVPFDPWITIGFCVILFAICSFNLWAKIRKEMKNSIVENIREL